MSAPVAEVQRPLPSPRYSPTFIRGFVALTGPLFRLWFRPRVEGLERVPDGGCVVAGNHSAFGVLEILLLLSLWYRAFGSRRPVGGLAHDIGMSWPLRWAVERIGGVRASRESARGVLGRGLPVLVFPGGDVDVFRPFSARYQVRWGGRSGFLQLALDAGVPIVPLAICGSHAQYTMLPGGERFARWIGLSRKRIHAWSMPASFVLFLAVAVATLAGALPWWAIPLGALAWLVPNPTRVDLRFLEPVDPRALVAEAGGVPQAAEALRRRVEDQVRELSGARRTPWF